MTNTTQTPTFPAADLDTLTTRTLGPVFLPDQPGYDEERETFEPSVDHHPAVIVGAAGPADIAAAVEFARTHGLGVAVQATGHGASVPADGALLITTRRMNGVRVDPTTRSAWIQAGATWEPVIHEAAQFGLAPLSGSAPFVGAVSYTIGGGLGLMSRRFGYAADHVRRLDLVTAGGDLLQVSPESHPDLFWALRGDKGNLGVVTAIEVDLMPVPTLYGGGLFFAAESARDLFHTYREWTASLPDEMTSSIAMIALPDIPEIPEPIRGRFVTHVRIAYLGSATDGERLIQPLRDVGPRLIDSVAEIPYTASGTIHNDPREPIPFYGSNRMLRDLDRAAIDTLLDVAGPDANSPYGFIELRHLGGALARQPTIPNAVANRDAAFTFYAISFLHPGGPNPVATHQALHERMAPWATGGQLLNFIAGPSTPDLVPTAYDRATYARLAALKATHDPTNLFRFNPNIPPTN